jgi:hypothetical protein
MELRGIRWPSALLLATCLLAGLLLVRAHDSPPAPAPLADADARAPAPTLEGAPARRMAPAAGQERTDDEPASEDPCPDEQGMIVRGRVLHHDGRAAMCSELLLIRKGVPASDGCALARTRPIRRSGRSWTGRI